MLFGCVDVNSGCSDVDRQAGICLSTQFDSITGDGRQHWLWHQQVMQYLLPVLHCSLAVLQ